jgi:hypothetical protein
VGINALANTSASAQVSKAFVDMREAVETAKRDPNQSLEDTTLKQDILGELSRREAERPIRLANTMFDKLRAANHAFFLGFSPSYVLVNLTQVGALLWPELAKKHGFVKSAKTIAAVTPMAFKIMKATLDTGRELGAKRAADAIITEEALRRAGVPARTAEFLMHVQMSGRLDMGSAARELGRVAEGDMDSKTDLLLRYAAAGGYYSETFTRLIAALSALELSSPAPLTDKLYDYTNSTIDESMLQYATWNTARLMGKMGVAGPMSPVMFSFMNYQFQVIEKMVREMTNAFMGHASTAAEKTEARRFMGAHLTAMTVLAGSLGLPLASVLARVLEKTKDMFDDDDEPYDVKVAWRNFLAGIFGPEMGEILAHGAFRGLSIDIANRVGEQDLLPMSRLLTDRRKWEDKSKDWAMQALGSPVGMLANIVQGGSLIAEGRVLDGMKMAMPTAIKGPLEAYRMTTTGYTDASGNTLPMTPGASAILSQALGLTPAEKAEYTEARNAQQARKGDLVQAASALRRTLALAVERQDSEALRSGLAEAQRFDRANPAYAVLPSLGETLRRRARARATASSLSNPLGTNLRDIRGRTMTDYANFGRKE